MNINYTTFQVCPHFLTVASPTTVVFFSIWRRVGGRGAEIIHLTADSRRPSNVGTEGRPWGGAAGGGGGGRLRAHPPPPLPSHVSMLSTSLTFNVGRAGPTYHHSGLP